MKEFLITLLAAHPYSVYAVVILLSCVEGPILSILLGLLVRSGAFHFLPAYAALMLGDVLGDAAWYAVGRFAGHPFISRFGRYVGVTEDKVSKLSDVFHRHKDWILVVSKVTNGFGLSLVTLLTAGIVKIPFLRYLAFNLIGQFVWTGTLMFVGYSFGGFYSQIDGWFGRISIVFIFVALCAAFVSYTRHVRARMSEPAQSQGNDVNSKRQ